MVGSQPGIPSLYSFVSLRTLLSSFKNLRVFFSFLIIFLVAFLNRSACAFLCSLMGSSLAVRLRVCFLCGRRLCSMTLGSECRSRASLVGSDTSCLLSCLILCSIVRASVGMRHIAITTITDVATRSLLGKPGTNKQTHVTLRYIDVIIENIMTRNLSLHLLSDLKW